MNVKFFQSPKIYKILDTDNPICQSCEKSVTNTGRHRKIMYSFYACDKADMQIFS